LAGITTIAAANRWLAETYWPAHNAALRSRSDRCRQRLRPRPHRPRTVDLA
jgi:hypothetical protein